ncbi:MAG: hypothetical protein ACRDQB_10090 [Thermocrispum sp.]
MGKKASKAATPTQLAQARVRKLIKQGKLKKKCCKSKPRCKRCPVLALKKTREDLTRAA